MGEGKKNHWGFLCFKTSKADATKGLVPQNSQEIKAKPNIYHMGFFLSSFCFKLYDAK